jgi:hypothetical protein
MRLMKIAQTFFLSFLMLGITLTASAQETAVTTQDTPPVPVATPEPPAVAPKPKEGIKFSFNGPTPMFSQLRTPRKKRTTGQFQFGAKGTLVPSSPLGKVVLESDNIASTDAFDIATRYGLKVSAEKNKILSSVAFTTNQKNVSPSLTASMGTRLPVWAGKTKVSAFSIQEAGSLDINFLRLENRLKVDKTIAPNHIGSSVLVPSVGLNLPTLFFGKTGKETNKSNTAHVLFSSNAWFFVNDKAAVGYKKRPFESQVLAQVVLPKEALPFKLPLIQGFSLNFARGANPASGYAPLNQFQFNLQLFDFAGAMKPKVPTTPNVPAVPK